MELEVKAKLYEIVERVWTRLQRREYEAEYELFVDDDDNDKVGSDRLFPIPKGDAGLWYQAMNVLRSYGVVYFSITDQDNNLVEINLDAGHKIDEGWCCYVSNFKRPKFIEFCKEQGIDLSKPIKLTYSARLVLSSDNVLKVEIDNRERLVYKALTPSRGLDIIRLILMYKNRGRPLNARQLTQLSDKAKNQSKPILSTEDFSLDDMKSFTDHFRSGPLKKVVSRVIDIYPNYICIPEEKDIDIATYQLLRDLSRAIEKIT